MSAITTSATTRRTNSTDKKATAQIHIMRLSRRGRASKTKPLGRLLERKTRVSRLSNGSHEIERTTINQRSGRRRTIKQINNKGRPGSAPDMKSLAETRQCDLWPRQSAGAKPAHGRLSPLVGGLVLVSALQLLAPSSISISSGRPFGAHAQAQAKFHQASMLSSNGPLSAIHSSASASGTGK